MNLIDNQSSWSELLNTKNRPSGTFKLRYIFHVLGTE